MVWSLCVSLVVNGVLAGFILGREWGWWEKQEEPPHIAREVWGGGVTQDPDMDYEWDKTVVGFKGANGK